MTPISEDEGSSVSPILRHGTWALLALAFGYGLYRVIMLHWVCDDAFISFRYARNLIDGHGLVFNIGEHVEGYSNFLWTILIAAGLKLGLDPVLLSEVLGALCWVATIVLIGYLSLKLWPNARKTAFTFMPLAALCLVLHHEFHVFATSGLESSMYTALLTLGFVVLVLAEKPVQFGWAGLVMTAAAMTRTEGPLFFALVFLYLALWSQQRWRRLAFFAAPFILLWLPYWIIRYHYYGFPYPNTYYAKSINLPYYSQGIEYLWLYVKSYYLFFLSPLAVIFLVWKRRPSWLAREPLSAVDRATLLSILFLFPYSFLVVRSGGDFMFGRFMIPVTPFALVLLEIWARDLFGGRRWYPIVVVASALTILLRWNPYPDGNLMAGLIANEPAFYPAEKVERARQVGTEMARYFAGQDVGVAFYGLCAMHAYYSNPRVAIESHTGLTDSTIAHRLLTQRARPGHEKPVTPDYLDQRHVDFLLKYAVDPDNYIDSLRTIRFGDWPVYIWTYNAPLMDHFRKFPEITFIDCREEIDKFIAAMPSKSNQEVIYFYSFFQKYYFDRNRDRAREMPFRARLSRVPQPK